MQRTLLSIVLFLWLSMPATANLLVNGTFEVNSLNGWAVTGTASIVPKGLTVGSAQSVQINAATGKIVQTVTNVGPDWVLDFYVACQDPALYSADRGFNLNINNSQLNMRIGAGGAIQFYNGSGWSTVGKGNEISFSTDSNNDGDITDSGDILKIHRIQIAGHNYGLGNSSYDVSVSAANSSVLTSLGKGVTFFQSTPTNFSTLIFTTAYGMKAPQTYLLDECSLVNLGGLSISQSGGKTIVEEKNETIDTIFVRLSNLPTANVSVQIAEKNTSSLSISPAQLLFTPANFDTPQKIIIQAKDDQLKQNGIYKASIGFSLISSDVLFQDKEVPDISVTIKDDDLPFVYPRYSGIYPHLAVTNSDGECGIGAVVPWQNDLWYVTYSAHYPAGSDDKLYQLDTALNVVIRPESVGGTPANRMIHKESNQLIIGSHIIDATKKVRTIPLSLMPGRMTANARHLTDPANRIYFITMEEGIYDVNVNTLEFKTIHADTNTPGVSSLVPGQHMKGAYSGQGRLIIANNGNGGVLAQWKGEADGNPNLPSSWSPVDVNKYTEVTTKGGIYGAISPGDPVWSLGWDKKSVLLNVCDNGGIWKRYRLPKASYTHDADHGWYTEWPRIRDIGYSNGNYLMNMHGMMYQFPATFSHTKTGGITPFSTFLKMIVDYTEWNGKIVLACNDATMFSNGLCPRDQSNLLFSTLEELANYGGNPYAFGGIWMNDSIRSGVPSEAMLINGFKSRIIHLSQNTSRPVRFTLETDVTGNNQWTELAKVTIPASGYAYYILPEELNAQWLRVVSDSKVLEASAFLYLSNPYCKPIPEMVKTIPDPNQKTGISFGALRPMSGNDLKLQFAANIVESSGELTKAYYEVDGNMAFTKINNPVQENALRTTYAPVADFTVDDASVIMTSGGKQYRLPMGDPAFSNPVGSGYPRGIREIVTERSVMNIHGTFYELPRDDSGGLLKIRPITTHNKLIYDYCSWRGMLVLSGNFIDAPNDQHYRKSDDGKAGLWFGNVDDLFKMGAPKGIGSTWKVSSVMANTPSLPYLMQGYNDKKLLLSHNLDETVTFTVEVDYMADGKFVKVFTVPVKPKETLSFQFPDGFQAHWARTLVDKNCVATATFVHNAEELTGTETVRTDDSQILVFPNPASGILKIQGLKKATKVDVFSLLGTKVISELVVDRLNVERLIPGVYFLSAGGNKSVCFIKK
ncbi:MAG: hypothetical protein JNK09_09900 [Prolixibacteraceae bacterium]|nr:hypothetical protein [Prolixibacteraceae bacterium]